MPGVRNLVTRLFAEGFDQAIGSSAPPQNIAAILKVLKLTDFFKVIISAADIQQGKPNPQVFLLAAQRLNIPPSRCLVIEDAPAGVEAGLAAGMKVIAVTNSWSREKLSRADLVVDNLEMINTETIRQLLIMDSLKDLSHRG